VILSVFWFFFYAKLFFAQNQAGSKNNPQKNTFLQKHVVANYDDENLFRRAISFLNVGLLEEIIEIIVSFPKKDPLLKNNRVNLYFLAVF
jgi:hypothetical protein